MLLMINRIKVQGEQRNSVGNMRSKLESWKSIKRLDNGATGTDDDSEGEAERGSVQDASEVVELESDTATL